MGFSISIITVTFNDRANLLRTVKSVAAQKINSQNIEYIVIDGHSTDGTQDSISRYKNFIDIFLSEEDLGIYDAMNKGIDLAKGDALLFLNSGDLLIGPVLSDIEFAPAFLPVFYTDILGRFKRVKIRNKKIGIPNCHQGILFPRTNLRYSLEYDICSDYDFFLRHNFVEPIPQIATSGYVYFLPGLSSREYKKRDLEAYEIRLKYFGLFFALRGETIKFLKRVLRAIIGKKFSSKRIKVFAKSQY